jgi:quercetin 2,3-dioxygenase
MRRRDFVELLAAGAAASAVPLGAGCVAERPLEAPATPRYASLRLRPSGNRGARNLGWLEARYSFSFAGFTDPEYTQFRALRVLNEDRIRPDGGFPIHPHRDMEIVTYLLEGELAHRDTLGNGGVIRRGEVQRMSAGSGIRHSEFNHGEGLTHLLQIWILPDRLGDAPSYEQTRAPELTGGALRLLASPRGRGGAVEMGADAYIHAAELAAGQSVSFDVAPARGAWVQLARGAVQVNGVLLEAGDAIHTLSGGVLEILAAERAEFLLFDLA